MQQTIHQIKGLVQDIENSSYELNVQIIQLDAVQDAVAQLMDRIDEIKNNGWNQEKGMACMAIGEIERTVRLIDMAFLPLKREMDKTVKELDTSSKKAYKLFKEENEKADAPTSAK
ncbi:hypothetical protein NYE67_02810 [Solibacillus sp. FSL W8-0474]|uniref:hypothetical protein n=1 Tax=Solibacillus sp. FSL W8-0474 TaxID=2975336 RepID=UPI0030F99FCD